MDTDEDDSGVFNWVKGGENVGQEEFSARLASFMDGERCESGDKSEHAPVPSSSTLESKDAGFDMEI